MSNYAFGHTDLALQRLQYLATVFGIGTEPFVKDIVSTSPELVLDLGCGPGDTTHDLAKWTEAKHAIGLDISDHSVALASETETAQVNFQQHDLTVTPFPTDLADLAYSRFVLTHLNNPAHLISLWTSQLEPKGLLLIEEVEWIRSEQGTFRTYLDIVAHMLADQKNDLYLGPVLDQLSDTNTWRKYDSQVRRLSVYNHQAATMFYMNIQAWKHRPFIQAHYDASQIEALEQMLKHLSESHDTNSQIEWGMRQITFQANRN
ncbi:MAG: class I SAM-dependent methyltransferase [Chloroflexota bacterium]